MNPHWIKGKPKLEEVKRFLRAKLNHLPKDHIERPKIVAEVYLIAAAELAEEQLKNSKREANQIINTVFELVERESPDLAMMMKGKLPEAIKLVNPQEFEYKTPSQT